MTLTDEAIYENGVLKLAQPLPLAEPGPISDITSLEERGGGFSR